jgi:EmrB/QacA subfamily drug resistance transporter
MSFTIPSLTKNMIALSAISLSSLMFGLEISSVPVILPTLEKLLHGSFNDMQWIMNAYTIAVTTVLMATGTLADRYGRRLTFIISVTLFGLTSLVCGLATNTSVLIVSRFLQGMSGGAMLICQVAVLSHQFQDKRARGKAFSIWGIIFGIGLGFGPIIGGLIVALSNWQWVFLIHVLLSAITLVLILTGVTESKNPDAGSVDKIGIVTLSFAVFGITYYITQGADLGFGSIQGLSILLTSIASFIIFIFTECKVAQPMFDFSVFKNSNFSGALLGSMGMNFSYWAFMIYLPIYFQSVLGYDSVTAGLSLLAYTLPTLLFPPLGEWLSMRYKPGYAIPIGLFTIGIGFFAMYYGCSREQATWLSMLPGSVIAGAGLGMTNTPVTNTTTASVPVARSGMASGIDMSARMISLALNIAIMGFLLVAGISFTLQSTMPNNGAADLSATAQQIAAGNLNFGTITSTDLAKKALLFGFQLIILYAAIGVSVIATISLMIFKPWSPVSISENRSVPTI